MLAATLFIALISHHMKHKTKAKCIPDKKELIRRLTEHKQYDEPYPNATLASEYDIIEEIYETCKLYNINTSYHWVRGHQDRTTEYEDLLLQAQLNVNADWYAGKYQDESGKYSPRCNILPSCPAMLSIRDISMTSDYKKQLILRLRGGDGRLTEDMENEYEVATRFRLNRLDEIESEPIGGTMNSPKLPGMIRILGCNPNGIKANQVKSHLQHAIDLEIYI
jgi:hypothetical protein